MHAVDESAWVGRITPLWKPAFSGPNQNDLSGTDRSRRPGQCPGEHHEPERKRTAKPLT
jgi:hypothetical protein